MSPLPSLPRIAQPNRQNASSARSPGRTICLPVSLFILSGVLAGCGGPPGPAAQPPSALVRPFTLAPAPDSERTIPTVELHPGESAVVDLNQYFAGWIEHLTLHPIQSFEAPSAQVFSAATADGNTSAPQPEAILCEEPSSIPAHRIQITLPADPVAAAHRPDENAAGQTHGSRSMASGAEVMGLWLLPLSFQADSIEVRRVLVIRAKGSLERQPGRFSPIPHAVDSTLTEADGGFAFSPATIAGNVDPASLRIVFGNEWIPVHAAKCSTATGENVSPVMAQLPVVAFSPNRFVVRGLRDLAGRRPSDSILRIYGKTLSGRWFESSFAFGGRVRPYFEPRDAVLYFALVDRLPNGRRGNDDPLPPDPAMHPLDNWQGGDADGLRSLVLSGYLTRLGVTALVLSPPFQQAAGPIHLERSDNAGAAGGRRTAAPYRGFAAVGFGRPEPRYGSREDWQNALKEAQHAGINVVFEYAPWLMHHEAELVHLHPHWFREAKPSELSPPSKDSGRFLETMNLSDLLAPSLRHVQWNSESDARGALTGYGLYWLRIVGADGICLQGCDRAPEEFQSLLATRIREEIVRPEGRGTFLLGVPLNSPEPEQASSIRSLSRPRDGQVDFPLSFAIRRVLAAGDGTLTDLDAEIHSAVRRRPDTSIACALSGSPELPRLASLAPIDRKMSASTPAASSSEVPSARGEELSLAALFTLPPVPGLYYGDEIGLDGYTIPENRKPLPARSQWNDEQRRRYEFVGRLAALRYQHPALRRGDYQTLAVTDESLVFCRAAWSEAIVVALHRGATPASLDIALPDNLRGIRRLSALIGARKGEAVVENDSLRLQLPAGSVRVWLAQ